MVSRAFDYRQGRTSFVEEGQGCTRLERLTETLSLSEQESRRHKRSRSNAGQGEVSNPQYRLHKVVPGVNHLPELKDSELGEGVLTKAPRLISLPNRHAPGIRSAYQFVERHSHGTHLIQFAGLTPKLSVGKASPLILQSIDAHTFSGR